MTSLRRSISENASANASAAWSNNAASAEIIPQISRTSAGVWGWAIKALSVWGGGFVNVQVLAQAGGCYP
jgi:hypothetical protein